MSFAGWLVKVNGTQVPMKFIKLATYDVTPNQRIEESADRSADGVLVRSTVAHMPSKIEWQTPHISQDDAAELVSLLGINSRANRGRDVSVEYFCPDTQAYQSGTFYVPDTKFSIYRICEDGKLLYAPVRVALIEY